MEQIVYDNIDVLLDLLENDDLPKDVDAFQYKDPKIPGNSLWVHKTELATQLVLRKTYGSYMRKR